MSERYKFDCNTTRARFAGAELSLQVIPRLVKSETVGLVTAAKMTRVAEVTSAEAVNEATSAGHGDCLGKKACQLALQSNAEVLADAA